MGEHDCRTQFWKRTIQWLFHQSLVLIELLVPDKIGSYVKLSTAVQPSAIGQRARPPDTILEEDHPMAILSKYGSNWAPQRFQTRRFLCEFPIGSYVKLSSAVGAIMFEWPIRRTHFWKITIQWLFHQNFVLIEQIFFKFHPPFFLICIIGQNRQKFKVHKKSRNICLKAHHYALTVQFGHILA